MKTYKVICSTNYYIANRNSKFPKNHNSYVVERNLCYKDALALLEEKAINYNDWIEFYAKDLDMISPKIMDHLYNVNNHYPNEIELQKYYQTTKKRWAVLYKNILENWRGAGYYAQDKFIYSIGGEMVELDSYVYRIVQETI